MEPVSKSDTTYQELFEMPDSDHYELVEGKLVQVNPASYEHGNIARNITQILNDFVTERSLGNVGVEAGFLLKQNPDTVRAPDVYFVTQERHEKAEITSYFPGPPDLAVEIISSHDKFDDITRKVKEYIQAGTNIVWIVNPRQKSVIVYEDSVKSTMLEGDEVLTANKLLPDFTCPVNTIFDI